jgi:DNA protecting protein DprA
MLGLSSSRRDDGRVMNIRVAKPRNMTKHGYAAPQTAKWLSLNDALTEGGRPTLDARQLDLLQSERGRGDVRIYYSGDITLLSKRCVSIVGTRDVSDIGRARASRLAKELSSAGVVVVSGLARGVDRAAHIGAIENGGSTIAVIGTPLNKAYPAENADLQEEIYRRHLLVSPFREGETTFKSNFPKRNRVMAALSDATVIVEASDTSGTLHQAAECQRLGRWLFILKSVVDDPKLKWPTRFLGKENVAVLSTTEDVIYAIGNKGN